MSNLKFQADIARFAALLETNIAEVNGALAVALHGRLGDATPYRSGRARAGWNIKEGAEPDLSVPPELPGNMLGSSAEEVAAARVVYDAIYDRNHAFVPSPGRVTIDGVDVGYIADVITISNSVPYIELLNAGWSRQAPAAFFEYVVGNMELQVNDAIAKLQRR